MESDANPTDDIPRGDLDVHDVMEAITSLEAEMADTREKKEVQRVRRMLEHVPGTNRIEKYTGRDMGEAFIGGLVFSLPLLVEDGVFDIAQWFVEFRIGSIPIFLTVNVLFILVVTAGLLYVVDIREVEITRPLFGVIPRRWVGILVISFLCAFGMMYLWGRLHEPTAMGDPTALESLGRVTVVWSAAALGAVLADVLPGESKGEDINDLIGK